MSLLVRDARPEEYDEVGALLVDVYARKGVTEGYLQVLRDVAARSDAPLTESLVAIDRTSGVILGTCVLAYYGSDWTDLSRPGEAGLRMLATAEDARRRGVGTALVAECIARARAAGCTGLALGTMESMTSAHRLYAGLGFVRTEERDGILPSGRTLMAYAIEFDPLPLVRVAEPSEFAAIGSLTVAAYAADGHLANEPDSSYAVELSDAGRRAAEATLLVAVDRSTGELLGTVTVCADGPFQQISFEDESEFRMLAVAPSARKQGVGEALIRAVLRSAREAGLRGVAASTASWMPAAHRLYERLGFVQDETRDWEPVPGIVLLAYTREV